MHSAITVYYSRGGRTQKTAERIAALTGSELYRIETAVPYPEHLIDCPGRAKQELYEGQMPELKGELPDLSGYEKVIFGYPCLWGTLPMPAASFLKRAQLGNAKLYLFATHDGAGPCGTEDVQNILGDHPVVPCVDAERMDDEAVLRWIGD